MAEFATPTFAKSKKLLIIQSDGMNESPQSCSSAELLDSCYFDNLVVEEYTSSDRTGKDVAIRRGQSVGCKSLAL